MVVVVMVTPVVMVRPKVRPVIAVVATTIRVTAIRVTAIVWGTDLHAYATARPHLHTELGHGRDRRQSDRRGGRSRKYYSPHNILL